MSIPGMFTSPVLQWFGSPTIHVDDLVITFDYKTGTVIPNGDFGKKELQAKLVSIERVGEWPHPEDMIVSFMAFMALHVPWQEPQVVEERVEDL